MAEEELPIVASERRAAALLQTGGTVIGACLPLIGGVFYLAVSVIFIAEPTRHMPIPAGRVT